MFKYTSYFEKDVLAKRPYIKKEWCERVQNRKLAKVQYGSKYLRVVTLSNQRTILNAFFDRNFKGVI